MISSLSMSPFISTPTAHTSCSYFLTMPALSSPVDPKGQMKLTVLFILLSAVLLASSCEARGVRVHGKDSSSKSHLPAAGKNVASLNEDGWLTRQADARTMVDIAIDDHLTNPDSKMKGVAMTSPAGAVSATPVVKVSPQLFQREDIGFHLDYAGPRTHPPSHN